MRLLLLGCSGFIGRELVPHLIRLGHDVVVVSRKPAKAQFNEIENTNLSYLQIDPSDAASWKEEALINALKNAEAVVNLVGEPIADKRWSSSHLNKLETSRISTTRSLVSAMREIKKPPLVLVNASAIGYYGTSRDQYFSEKSPAGNDFLATLCTRWEEEASKKPKSTRLLVLRIGIVLGADGGALGKMLPVFRAGLGGPIGNGQQWMSWIHRTDLCELISHALVKRGWFGQINAVSPEPVSMSSFAVMLGKILGRPSALPVPGFVLQFLLGDGARVVLEGQNVESVKLAKLGFKFKYPSLEKALDACVSSK